MKTKLIKKEIIYNGTQLTNHFAFKHFGLAGNSIIAFMGPVDVKITEMVDLEDVRHNEPIRSDMMLSFIIEAFDMDLRGTVWMQRMLMALMQNELNRRLGSFGVSRVGDDLMFEGRKLTVSIAAQGQSSCMIHSALNIKPTGAPVPIACLEEMQVDSTEFATTILQRFSHEFLEVEYARVKVRALK